MVVVVNRALGNELCVDLAENILVVTGKAAMLLEGNTVGFLLLLIDRN